MNSVFSIDTPAHFSFHENLKYMSRSTNECMFDISHSSIVKAINAAGETLLIEISWDGDALIVSFLGDNVPSSEKVLLEVENYVRDLFDLDRDLTPFYEIAKNDALLHEPARQFYGLRIIGIPELFEAVCWGIIGQQINLAFAYTLKRRFVETYGTYVEWNEQKYWLFPSPQLIAGLSVQDLADLKMTTKKSEYIIETARRIVDGSLSKEALRELGNCSEAEKNLVSIRGIGPWTANYVLMRCLRYQSAFPIDDVGLHNAIKHLKGMDRKPSKAELRDLASKWNGWESYATFYLWRVLY